MDAGPDGFGRLAVRGPGLFSGYLNARAAYTADGFFLTGDTAAIAPDGKLYVKERTDDMFVSGGENVYPAEIREKLLRVPGVADAYIFGAPTRNGAAVRSASSSAMRPSTCPGPCPPPSPRVPRDSAAAPSPTAYSPRRRRAAWRPSCRACISRSTYSCSMRSRAPGIGKVDRSALRKLYEQRIEVKRVNCTASACRSASPSPRRRGRCRFANRCWWKWWTMPAVRALASVRPSPPTGICPKRSTRTCASCRSSSSPWC